LISWFLSLYGVAEIRAANCSLQPEEQGLFQIKAEIATVM